MSESAEGYSILEFIVSTLISVPLVLLLVYSVTASHTLLIKSSKAKEQTVATIALYRALERTTADLDTHPFALPPRSHVGSLTYFNGSPLNRPAYTKGVTTTALRFFDTVRLEAAPKKNRGCMVFQSRGRLLSGSKIRTVLLLGADGFFEAHAALSTDSDPACYRITLTAPAQSMITETPSDAQIELARYAIPIRWIQTYVRDTKGTLRVFRHAGSELYLNQPIAKRLPDFTVAISIDEQESRYAITLQTEQHKNLAFTHRIPRTNFRHVLWSLR